MTPGWLRYGDAEGVVLRHSLQHSLAQVDADELLPYTTVTYQGAGIEPVFDAVKGMSCRGVNGSAVNPRLSTPTAAMPASIKEGGQLSMEVSTAWVAMYNDGLGRGTQGYQPSVTEYLLRGESIGTVTYAWITKMANGGFQAMMGPNANQKNSYSFALTDLNPAAGTFNKVNSVGKGEYTTLNLGWTGGENGGLFFLAVDGMLWTGNYRVRDGASTSNMFEFLHIGGLSGNQVVGLNSAEPLWLRNLQISTAPPVFATPAALRQVYVLSDSIFDVADLNALVYDAASVHTLRRYINQRGVKFGGIVVDENAGYSISTLGTQLKSKITALINAQPSTVILNGGTNDLGNAGWPGDFTTEYRDLLEQIFFGTSKTGRTTVQLALLNGPPPRGAPADVRETQHEQCRQYIKDVVSWWDSTYPSLAGRVVYVDIFGGLGGRHNPPEGVLADGIHLSYQGANDFGLIVGKALYTAMARV